MTAENAHGSYKYGEITIAPEIDELLVNKFLLRWSNLAASILFVLVTFFVCYP